MSASEPASARRRISQMALGIALLSAILALSIWIFGGFETRIAGLKITARDPLRALVVSIAALMVLVIANGPARAREVSRAAAAGSFEHLGSRVRDWPAAFVLAAAVVATGLIWNTRAAGGSDSYGYVSQAELWLAGHVTIDQPWVRQVPWPNAAWTFTPLAYRPRQDGAGLVSIYAPGLPMLMALAKRVAGQCALFAVGPLAGGLLILATVGIGRRLGASRAGLVAAWLVATSPVFLHGLVQPMSDVPVAAAWAAVLWCLLGETVAHAAAAGVIASMAILIRPNLVLMAGVIGLWLAVMAWRADGAERTSRIRQTAAFTIGLIPAILTTAVLNQILYGSPLRSGYGNLPDIFGWSNIPVNVLRYARWFVTTQTPLALLGVAALAWPAGGIWPRAARPWSSWLFAALALVLSAEYFAYAVFEDWSYLRFFLPIWPLVMIGLALVLLWPVRPGRPVVALLVTIVTLGIGLHGIRQAADRFAFDWQQWESKYARVAALVAAKTPGNAVIFSEQHGGSLRYYAGRMTITFAAMDPRWLDRSVEWLAAHGVHPYAVLEDWEVREFKKRFGAANTLGQLAMTPLGIDVPARVYVYDLLRPADSRDPVEVIAEPSAAGCTGPAMPPTLEFKS